MTAFADYEGLTRADVERCLCEPCGLRFDQLVGFPPPTFATTNGKTLPRWSGSDLLPHLQGFFRGIARGAPDFGEFVALEESKRPNASAEELLEYAIERFVDVKVARVLVRRPAYP